MKRRERITLNGTTLDLVVQMAEGNPGAVTALAALIKDDDMALMRILDLDDMGMRGSQIWVAYKDHCKGDIEAFRKALINRDPAMVATVNASRGHADGTPVAVTGGAS
jgi:DNA-binding transcriptional LysR family regulator